MTFAQDWHVVCQLCSRVVPELVDGWACRQCKLAEREDESTEWMFADEESPDPVDGLEADRERGR